MRGDFTLSGNLKKKIGNETQALMSCAAVVFDCCSHKAATTVLVTYESTFLL
jgi:hypothetical protein